MRFFWILSIAIPLLSFAQTQNVKEIKLYHPNGAVRVLATEVNGRPHGVSKIFFDNGVLKGETSWVNGVKEGSTKRWFRNGKIDYTGFMKNNLESGDWKYHDDDGTYIYTVNYKAGNVIGYSIEDTNKYRWRPIDIGGYKVGFQFPLYLMDSLVVSEKIKGGYTMYPNRNKRDLEYYGVMSFPTELFPANLDVMFSDFKPEYLQNELGRFLLSDDTTRPNFYKDKFHLESAQTISIESNKVYSVKVVFDELNELAFEALYVPYGDRMYLIFGYFRKEVDLKIRSKYFSSVTFK